MEDFNKTLTPGDIESGIINVVVEIPAGSSDKIEWHRKEANFQIDRVESSNFQAPASYGFIPKTLNDDGNELDVLIIADEPIETGVALQTRIIGVMKFTDEGKIDDKIIVVPVDNTNNINGINKLSDIPKQKIDQITYHFSHYKDAVKPNCTVVGEWADFATAQNIILESINRWDNQSSITAK